MKLNELNKEELILLLEDVLNDVNFINRCALDESPDTVSKFVNKTYKQCGEWLTKTFNRHGIEIE